MSGDSRHSLSTTGPTCPPPGSPAPRPARLAFRELQSRCDGVSPTVLNRRLKELRELDLLDHDGAGYGYTRWGREQLGGLTEWSQGWGRHLARAGLKGPVKEG